MNRHYLVLILTLIICIKSFAQQENLYYEKGLEVVLDSLIKERPKLKFYLTNEKTLLDTSGDAFGSFDCNINFDNLKQSNSDVSSIVIPVMYRDRLKKNGFFNRLIYGANLVELIIDVLYKDANNVLFRANIYDKEGGVFMFVQFKIDSLDVDGFCKQYSIY